MAGRNMGLHFLLLITLSISTNVVLKCEATTYNTNTELVKPTTEITIVASTMPGANGDDTAPMFLTPPKLDPVFEYSQYVVSVDCSSLAADTTMSISTNDPGITRLVGNKTLTLRAGVEDCTNLTVVTDHLGRGRLYFEYSSAMEPAAASTHPNFTLPDFYDIVVIRMPTVIDMIFVPAIITLAVCTNIIMGTEVNFPTIKAIAKKPIGLIVAGFCQFVTMPLIAFGICKLVDMPGDVAIGLLLVGCAPGGGTSNMLTFLIDGEVTLSIAMTFFSTALAMGMMPLNTFVYARWVTTDDTYSASNIPYTKLLTTIVSLTIPVGVGMLVKRFLPNFTKKAMKVFKPFVVVTILVVIATGVYNGLYIFRLMTPTMIMISYLLPVCGFISGGLGAAIFGQRCSKLKTIAIEVGIQNGGVVATMSRLAFEQPDADLAIIVPVCIMIMTSSLTIAIGVIHVIAKKCIPRYRDLIRRDKLAMREEGLMDAKQAKQFDDEEHKNASTNGHRGSGGSSIRFSQIVDFDSAKESYI